MSVTAVPTAIKPLPSPALKRYSWAVLAYFIAVILWGAVTRATGAGNGCGNHWPLCNGTVMQHSASVDTIIEFTHRITSGISLFALDCASGVDVPGHCAGTPGATCRRCFAGFHAD